MDFPHSSEEHAAATAVAALAINANKRGREESSADGDNHSKLPRLEHHQHLYFQQHQQAQVQKESYATESGQIVSGPARPPAQLGADDVDCKAPLGPFPFFFYRDFSALTDPDPLTPLTAPGRVPNFPAKMHSILSRPDLADIVAWMPHGRSWRVLKPREFECRVIPTYFEHAKFSSFIRQANGWGFRRITQGRDRNSYYHELFLRGLPHLCKMMKRPGVSEKQAADPDHEPDFYEISASHPVPEKAEDDSILLHCTLQGGPKARMPIYFGTVTPSSTSPASVPPVSLAPANHQHVSAPIPQPAPAPAPQPMAYQPQQQFVIQHHQNQQNQQQQQSQQNHHSQEPVMQYHSPQQQQVQPRNDAKMTPLSIGQSQAYLNFSMPQGTNDFGISPSSSFHQHQQQGAICSSSSSDGSSTSGEGAPVTYMTSNPPNGSSGTQYAHPVPMTHQPYLASPPSPNMMQYVPQQQTHHHQQQQHQAQQQQQQTHQQAHQVQQVHQQQTHQQHTEAPAPSAQPVNDPFAAAFNQIATLMPQHLPPNCRNDPAAAQQFAAGFAAATALSQQHFRKILGQALAAAGPPEPQQQFHLVQQQQQQQQQQQS